MDEDSTETRSVRPSWRAVSVVLAVTLVFHALVALWIGGFADLDPWFHIRLADLMARGEAPWHGGEAPWLAFSAWADFPADWALGWHWLLVPFTWLGDLEFAMRAAVVVFAAVVTTVFHGVLVRAGVRWPWAWTALLLVGGAGWLWRTHLGRPTPLVVALSILLVVFVAERRPRWTCACALVSLLLYQVPAPTLLAGACGCLGLALTRRQIPWREGLAVLGGVALGSVLHPGFWSVGEGGFFSLDHATFHVWELMRGSLAFAADGGVLSVSPEIAAGVPLEAGAQLGVPLPQELQAPSMATLWREFPVALLATVLAVPLALLRRWDAWSVGFGALAVAGLFGTLGSGRFVEYWHPFAVLAAALSFRSVPDGGLWMRQKLVGGVLVISALSQPSLLIDWRRAAEPRLGEQVQAAAASIATRAEPGDVVWHGAWDDFAPLFHANPDVRWLTGMDPWFFVAKDPGLVCLHAVCMGEQVEAEPGQIGIKALLGPDELHVALRNRFGARFVLLWKRRASPQRYALIEHQLRAADWATVLHEDAHTLVFELE